MYRRRGTTALVATVLSAVCLPFVGLAVAGPAGAAAASVEAETMTNVVGSSFARDADSASGGRERVFWSNGTANGVLETSTSFSGLEVRARGDQCGGSPTLRVQVDGKLVASRYVSSKQWATYAFEGSWVAGRHAVEVSFTNDRRTRWCDRNLYVDVVTATKLAPAPTPVAPTPTTSASSNPFAGTRGYVDPWSSARREADARRAWDPTGAAALDRIAAHPQAEWFGDWISTEHLAATVDARVSAATASGSLPVLVAYAIPYRDCGGYSAGGLGSPAAYAAWIDQLARGIGDRPAVVVLEPDALPLISCLDATRRAERLAMLSDAVARLAGSPRTAVYLDAGHGQWQPVDVIAAALRDAGVGRARGFALNVSNFVDTPTNIAYGEKVSALLGGTARFIVDTSRNGLGSNGEWCNPSGRALGTPWTSATGSPYADALLWVKRPGESDGTCNGGPSAGQFWVDYAIGLGQRATF